MYLGTLSFSFVFIYLKSAYGSLSFVSKNKDRLLKIRVIVNLANNTQVSPTVEEMVHWIGKQ